MSKGRAVGKRPGLHVLKGMGPVVLLQEFEEISLERKTRRGPGGLLSPCGFRGTGFENGDDTTRSALKQISAGLVFISGGDLTAVLVKNGPPILSEKINRFSLQEERIGRWAG